MQRVERIFWFLFLLLFFASLLWLTAGVPLVFNSPDESANYWFAHAFSESGKMRIHEPMNASFQGLVHPRSVTAMGEWLVPVSFLGAQLIFGIVGAIFTSGAMMLVTPIFAVLALLAWRGIVLALFKDRHMANISAFLFAIHPAFWYYSGRVMMHNVLFVSLAVLAAWFYFVRPISERLPKASFADFLFAGACFALAATVRTVELFWLVPLFLFVAWIGRSGVNVLRVGWIAVGMTLILIPFFLVQDATYGSPFTFGYRIESGPSVENFGGQVVMSAADTEVRQAAGSGILPFGFHPRAIARHAWYYTTLLYPWMMLPAVMGVLLLLFKSRESEVRHKWLPYIAVILSLGTWLVVFYGSWTFNDNPDPRVITLGNSYVRYWLPIFLLLSPLAAYFLRELQNLFSKRVGTVLVFIVLAGFFGGSLWKVLDDPDGFIATRRSLLSFVEKRDQVLKETPKDAVIIADRADKFLFPWRSVVVPLRSDVTYAAIPTLAGETDVYYFGITLPMEDIEYLNTVKLHGTGFQFQPMVTVQDETLYYINQ